MTNTNLKIAATAIHNADGEDRLLNVREVAELMGLQVGSVYHLISQKRIPVVRLSARCVRVRLSALMRMWDELTEQRLPHG